MRIAVQAMPKIADAHNDGALRAHVENGRVWVACTGPTYALALDPIEVERAALKLVELAQRARVDPRHRWTWGQDAYPPPGHLP
jgi:hypothetical protein